MKQILRLLLIVLPFSAPGQMRHDTLTMESISEKALQKIEGNIQSLTEKIQKNYSNTIKRLNGQEHKLKKKLSRKDSVVSQQLFKTENAYNSRLKVIKSANRPKIVNDYIPELDSLKTTFKFLAQVKISGFKLSQSQMEIIYDASNDIRQLEDKFWEANEVKTYILERKQQIENQFEKYGLAKKLTKFNKEVYYYQQRLNEYKSLLHDPKKLQQKAITKLRKLPGFKDFMKRNSELAELFRVPGDYGTSQALSGLQTRTAIQASMEQRYAVAGINPQQFVLQQVQQATTAATEIRTKLGVHSGGGSYIDMPDFKPNSQKTKNFLKRIEYGGNIQSQKANGLLPVTSDIAFTAGYKFNDKSIAGLGASYRLGWGTSIKHIKLSSQGMGLRSYVDVKVRHSFSVTGGYEKNYLVAFTKPDELNHYNAWQTSGLLGLTRKYRAGKRTNNFQLLWDFLSYNQVPRTQPILFRIGVTFR